MGELANYSIETDHVVLLHFKDGRRVRVATDQIQHHLTPRDTQKIRSAIKLRHDFLRRHMPKAVILLVAGTLAAFASTSRVVAQLLPKAPSGVPASSRPSPAKEPASTPTPSGSPQPAPPAPAVKGIATVAAPAPKRKAARKRRRTITPTPAISAPVIASQPTPLPTPPLPGPTPVPSVSPEPTPVPSPTPPHGDVLGDQTGPGDTTPGD